MIVDDIIVYPNYNIIEQSGPMEESISMITYLRVLMNNGKFYFHKIYHSNKISMHSDKQNSRERLMDQFHKTVYLHLICLHKDMYDHCVEDSNQQTEAERLEKIYQL